ncbi:sigma-70 family RNA polymerase sigma factor [Anaerococcus degeneri]|uniref:Sigma-70 family RNA polymerase sigma factor n=1 Tax=Anaerococcus degeneri TaxID=361500 RepID=A0ABS7YYE0_9FIRM|nr:sigma-70 family RNA polymerase sigma factor [Anaerococcus degeneri]MBP2015243.1 RNA polymerase sigma factor (sigma-70 family) [Anaerococcus degeneri]MCA2096139.1 sigma-70 family RNA polymerase sigma factor [Anaerococcus degeneri]
MDKINLKDKENLEKLRDYLDTSDLSEEELIELVDAMTDEQKEEILDIISEEDDEDFDDDDDLIGSAKKGVNTSLAPIKRKDMMKLSDLNNEEIVEQFQLGNQNALSALVEKNQGLVRSRASYFFRSHGNDLDLEDLVQSGMLGMIRAAEKFDLTLGYKFTTYAYKWIDKAIRKAINKEGHTIRIPAGKYLKLNKLKQILKANPEASDEELYRILENEGINKKQADDLFLINRNQVNSTSLNINLDSEDSTGDELMDMVGDESTPVDMLILEKDMENFLMQALDQLTEREKQIIIYRYGLDNEKPKTLEQIGAIYDLSRERIRQIENQALGKLKDYSDSIG